MFSGNRKKNAAPFIFLVKELSFKHQPGVFIIEFRFIRCKHGEKCVFLKTKNLKKEKQK